MNRSRVAVALSHVAFGMSKPQAQPVEARR